MRETLEAHAERIRTHFDARNQRRDELLAQARTLTRYCSQTIRSVHREEFDGAQEQLAQAAALVRQVQAGRETYPDLYYAGYTQDALKEFAEASLVFALVQHADLPSPEELGVEDAVYLQGLAEAAGELRRRSLDLLLRERQDEAMRLLEYMDDIYATLVTMDYPDAITGGLRRLTDLARSIIERTRGDLTISIRQERLEKQIRELNQRLDQPA